MNWRSVLLAFVAAAGPAPVAAAATHNGPHFVAQARAAATIHKRVEVKGGRLRVSDDHVAMPPSAMKTRKVDREGGRLSPDIPTSGVALLIVDLP